MSGLFRSALRSTAAGLFALVLFASPAYASVGETSSPLMSGAGTSATTAPLTESDPEVSIMGGFASRPVGTFSYSWKGGTINVPTGCFLNMRVHGDGLALHGTTAAVDCIGPAAIVPLFCNYRGRYRFLDTNGKEYASRLTPLKTGCGQASYPLSDGRHMSMRTGSICLDFVVNGTTRGTTCMAVFP